jgi:hypothetical protein
VVALAFFEVTMDEPLVNLPDLNISLETMINRQPLGAFEFIAFSQTPNMWGVDHAFTLAPPSSLRQDVINAHAHSLSDNSLGSNSLGGSSSSPSQVSPNTGHTACRGLASRTSFEDRKHITKRNRSHQWKLHG